MLTVFCDIKGVIIIDFFEKGSIVNSLPIANSFAKILFIF